MNKDEIENKIEQLEKEVINYLEVDDKAGARRIKKKIEKLEMQLQLLDLNKIKRELKAYKEVLRNYPELQKEVKRILAKGDE